MAASDPFYQEIVEEVNAVLDELGTSYQVRGHSNYSPSTLSNAETAPRTVVGLVADQSLQLSSFAQAFGLVGDSTQNWQGKKTLILAASSTPQPEEEIEVDGHWFSLSKVVEIKPADITVVYMLDVTR